MINNDKKIYDILYILDLDRTIFDTDQHFHDFCEVLKVEFDINPVPILMHEKSITKTPGPYSPLDDIRYNLEISISPEEIIEKENSLLASSSNKYLYSDAIVFLEKIKQQKNSKIIIATVGTHEYQMHKRHISPALHGIDMMITSRPKSQLFAESLTFLPDIIEVNHESVQEYAKSIIFVDDRAGTFDGNLPDDHRFQSFRIIRPLKDRYSEQTSQPSVPKIKELPEILKLKD